MSVHTVYPCRPERVPDPLDLELQMVARHHMGADNRTLCKMLIQ